MKTVLLSLVLLAVGSPAFAGTDAVLAWNQTAASAGFAAGLDNEQGCVDPLHESRMFAMMHVASHDALNAIDRRFAPYVLDTRVSAAASPEAAVAAAAHAVLIAVLPELPAEIGATPAAAIALADAAYTAALAAIPDSAAKTEGILIGQAAARAIIALRTGDGAEAQFLDFGYVPGPDPGDFQFVPGTDFVAAPMWGEVMPFALRAGTQFRSQPPYRVSGKKYAADFNEVKSLGAADSTTRTADQTEIAVFWVEGIPQAFNRIARTVSVASGLDLWENARLFALMNMASADGYIADFAMKYTYHFWRPVSAIHAADADGNPATDGDSTWTPLRGTPPAPDHTSGHSVNGAAMAEVLARFFGTDAVGFSTSSTTLPGVTRFFASFSEAAEENADSRVYFGFHFRHAVMEGLKLGTKVGRFTFTHYLKPVH